MGDYNVLGIDPASSKLSTVFDGTSFHEVPPGSLRDVVCASPDTLICWDAPLTGPPDEVESIYEGDLCTRVVEKYLGGGVVRWSQRPAGAWRPQRGSAPPKAPAGISVLGFAGLTHWTISRRTLGLPRVGPFDAALTELPARLITEGGAQPPAPDERRPSVVEVHPAVALWLWRAPNGRTTWLYKRDGDVLRDVWGELKAVLYPLAEQHPQLKAGMEAASDTPGVSDDHLDAFIAWALGLLWTRQAADQPAVVLLGDARTGAMLVPLCELTSFDLGAAFARSIAGANERARNHGEDS
ncbi:MAG: DUF429 domain-containing protein [Deltaproteobacteria bacterium]|nr:DUF429 domain-containing protein [Deltaproteobacteria bacterium]